MFFKSLLFIESGLCTDQMEIDREFQVIVCGRKRAMAQFIMQEHGVNLYFPSPLYGDFAISGEDTFKTVFISGKPSSIAKAKDIIQKSLHVKVNHSTKTFQQAETHHLFLNF